MSSFTNLRSRIISGALHFFKLGGDDLAVFDPETLTITIPSGALLDIAAGAHLQNDGVNLDLSSGIATSTTSTTGELNTLHSVVAGTAAASKAVVLDASKGVVGLGPVGLQRVVSAAAGDGAVAIAPKLVKITKAGVCALTLADPAAGDEGTVITFIDVGGHAHTVSNAAGSGFNSVGAGGDVATFDATVGSGLTVIALGSKWYVVGPLQGVTLG